MKDYTALTKAWGLSLIVLAGVVAFPALGHLIEFQQHELWLLKTQTMGNYYPIGMLFWSYLSIIVIAVYFIGTGIKIIQNSDPKAQEG